MQAVGSGGSQAWFSPDHQHRSLELNHLDLLWELWRQHGHSSDPAPLCTDPQSPRLLKLEPSKLQEPLLSFGVFTGAEFSKPSLEVSLLSSHSTRRDFPPVP